MPDSNMSDLETMEDFRTTLSLEENLSQSTITAYCSDLEQFFEWLRSRNLTFSCEMDESLFTEYFLLISEYRKSNTANRKLSSLKKFFLWLSSKNLKNKNIFMNLLGFPTDSCTLVASRTKERGPGQIQNLAVFFLIQF